MAGGAGALAKLFYRQGRHWPSRPCRPCERRDDESRVGYGPQVPVIPRHRVSPAASPMTGSSGVSSTLRLLDSITDGSGILDHPLSRVMTRGGHASTFRFEFQTAGSFLTSPRLR